MSTKIDTALSLSRAEQEALVTVGDCITWTVSSSSTTEYGGDVARMLANAEALLLAARVTTAAASPSLDPALAETVTRAVPECIVNVRELVADAEVYDEKTRARDALVLEGLLSLEQRLGAVTA